MNSDANFKSFLYQSSQSQNIFKWCSIRNDYMYRKGARIGYFIGDLIVDHREEEKEFLEELYSNEETNYHTKKILKDIVKIHFKSKRDTN